MPHKNSDALETKAMEWPVIAAMVHHALAAGKSAGEIAASAGVHLRTARKWIARVRASMPPDIAPPSPPPPQDIVAAHKRLADALFREIASIEARQATGRASVANDLVRLGRGLHLLQRLEIPAIDDADHRDIETFREALANRLAELGRLEREHDAPQKSEVGNAPANQKS